MTGQAPPAKEAKHVQLRKRALVDAGKPGEPKWRVRSFFRFLASAILLPLFRVRVSGVENIPQQRPVLLSPNHLSNMDGLIVFALTKRYNLPLRILAKRELWNIRPLGWLLDSAGILPISRDKADLDTLRTASAALSAGDSMAIFPEGTRIRNEDMLADEGGALGEASGGAAWLAIRNDVPVIPLGISGTEYIRPDGMKLMRFPAVNLHFGPALNPAEAVPASDYKRKERVLKLTELIMAGLAEAVDQARTENSERRPKLRQ